MFPGKSSPNLIPSIPSSPIIPPQIVLSASKIKHFFGTLNIVLINLEKNFEHNYYI